MFHLTKDDARGVWEAGDVIRPRSILYPFCDHVIMGFDGEGVVKVARPYAYVSGAGTTGPSVLLGTETYEIPYRDLGNFDKVGDGRLTP